MGGKIVYPTRFRIDDALDTALEMGENVVRVETFAESHGNPLALEPALGQFNEEAFEVRDYVLKAAAARGLRLIVPLVDNWYYSQGGKHCFTDWRGLTNPRKEVPSNDPKAHMFYTDPQVIEDFQAYVARVINHVNRYTGLAYKDDPAIFCWETGDELQYCPGEWTQQIAAFIKRCDPRHLVMDGKNIGDGFNYYPWNKLGQVDIESPHYHTDLLEPALKIFAREKKVTIIGEFKWNGDVDLRSYLQRIEDDPRISGDLYWNLMPHADDHGFVQHDDGLTLHYPGDTAQMRARVALLRAHAYRLRGEPAPPPRICPAPLITSITRRAGAAAIAWRGVAGADKYAIERSVRGPNGPWVVVADGTLSDNDAPWLDNTAGRDAPAWYRVRANNVAGVPGAYSQPAMLQK